MLEHCGGDPDKLALLFVQQWLHEQGYEDALKALETGSGLLYDDTKLEKSSQLIQLVWKHLEDVMLEQGVAASSGTQEAAEKAEEEAMLRGGCNDYPQTVQHTIEGVHPSSVVCVRFVPGQPHVLTGSGDGIVRRVGFNGDVSWSCGVGSGGALALDVHPAAYCRTESQGISGSCGEVGHGAPSSSNNHTRVGHQQDTHNEASCTKSISGAAAADSDTAMCQSTGGGGVASQSASAAHSSGAERLVAAGSMDGSVTLIDMDTGQALISQRLHNKYVVRVAWSGDGNMLATCSHDQTVQLHMVNVQHTDHGLLSVQLNTIKTIQYTTSVQDVCFLEDGVTVVVALRDTNYLRVLSLNDLEAPERMVNMNSAGDDHVSFFARHLEPSPCGRFLLVSTDTGRMIMIRLPTWKLCRFMLYSLPTEQFHQFCAAWHRDSHYVFAGAAGAQVWVYHVGSGKVMAKLPLHKVNVRDLAYDADRNLLATASFDKTVKIVGFVPAAK